MPALTIFEALDWGASKLKAANIASAKFDAQLLLASSLKKTTAQLVAHGEEPLTEAEQTAYMRLIDRRAAYEPVAYLLGKKDFFRRTFTVTPATLIPRPETEMLVELVLAEAGNDCLIVDVGTGSGAIAISLAAESELEVIACDTSLEALRVAQSNASTLGLSERIGFLHGHLLEPFLETYTRWQTNARPACLLLVANLPYLNTRQWEALPEDIKNYEPKQALHGGSDGLSLYDELLMQLARERNQLPTTLKVFFEIDPVQSSAMVSLIRHYFPAASPKAIKDLNNHWRFVIAQV